MKNIIFLFLMIALIGFYSACKSNSDKKEAAKKYLLEQLKGTNKEQESRSIMDYDKEVKVISDMTYPQFITKGVVLVDFWATWCKPCLMQAPIVEDLAKEFGDKVRFGKMDVDRNKQTAEDFEIINIPTLMLFKDGKMVERFTGLQQKETLKLSIEQYL